MNRTYEFPDGTIRKYDGATHQYVVIGHVRDDGVLDIPLSDLVSLDAQEQDPEEIKKRIKRTDEYIHDPRNTQQFRDDQKERRARAAADRDRDEIRKAKEAALGQEHDQSQFSNDFQTFMKRRYGGTVQEISTRSKIARNYMGTDILAPGTKEEIVEKDKPPLITVYVDYSGSIGDAGRIAAQKILGSIRNYELAGKIKTKIKFFASNVADTVEGLTGFGTSGDLVLKDITESMKKENLENVIIMTDNGFNCYNYIGTVVVPGCVWLFFVDGDRDEELVQKLRGDSSPYQICYSWSF